MVLNRHTGAVRNSMAYICLQLRQTLLGMVRHIGSHSRLSLQVHPKLCPYQLFFSLPLGPNHSLRHAFFCVHFTCGYITT